MDLQDPVLLGGALLAGAATLTVWLAARSRQRARRSRLEIQARREGMGLRRSGGVDPETIRRVQELFRRPDGEAPRILEVWERQVEGARLYLIGISAADSGQGQATALAALRSEDLDLPRISLMGLLDQDGMLADLANQAMRMAFRQVANQVEFSSPAEFHRHYLVGGPDEEALRRFLDEDRRAALGKTRSWHLEGEQDLLAMSLMPLEARGRVDQNRNDEALIREAMVALRVLRRAPGQTPSAPESGA